MLPYQTPLPPPKKKKTIKILKMIPGKMAGLLTSIKNQPL